MRRKDSRYNEEDLRKAWWGGGGKVHRVKHRRGVVSRRKGEGTISAL